MSTTARDGRRRALGGIVGVSIVAVSIVVALCLLALWFSPRSPWHNAFDLRVYRGAVRWWLDGRPLYDFVRPYTDKGFTYPPFALLVLLPLGLGTETTAIVLLTAVSAGLVVLTTWWLVAPIAARHGWPRWLALGVAVPLVYAMEPVREALGWGQIDIVIAALVLADVGALRRGRPWAGVWIGLATAIKVTPGLFVIYLAVTRRWRAAAVAAGTFGATVVAGFAVDPSPRYWTHELWQTGRVGPPLGENNQSLLGLLTRIAAPAEPSAAAWPALAALLVIVGLTRAARVHRRGDDLAGVTVTGLTACLISPISWVHHLYWVVPAVVVLVDVAAGTPMAATSTRRLRAGRVGAGALALVVAGAFISSSIWFFAGRPPGAATIIGENLYVFLVLALVLVLPARSAAGPAEVPAAPGAGSRAENTQRR